MRDAFMRWTTALRAAWAQRQAEKAFYKAMKRRYAENNWFVLVLLTLHAVTAGSACAHQCHVQALTELQAECHAELRHEATVGALEGMGARLDAIQADCDARAEGLR